MVLIDTSAWILALKPGESKAALEVDRILSEDKGATTGIIILELLSGTRTEKEYQELREDLEALYYLDTPKDLWLRASHSFFHLRRRGITIPATDIIIATLAKENDCVLLHADHHFELAINHMQFKTINLLE